MNKTYKVIYNRTRCMYQVVSELAKGRTKSETPEMLKTVFSKHGSLARGIVMTVLSMSLAMPWGWPCRQKREVGIRGVGILPISLIPIQKSRISRLWTSR